MHPSDLGKSHMNYIDETLQRGGPRLPTPFRIWPPAPHSLSFLYHFSLNYLCVLPKLFLPSISLLPEISFICSLNQQKKILASRGRSKYVVYCWWKCQVDVSKLADRSKAKENLTNRVILFNTMPRIFCSSVPKLISIAPCSLVFFCPMLPAPCTFGSHSPCSLKPLAESHWLNARKPGLAVRMS